MTRTRTTRWVSLLSVVLALALTAALAACGSDEPSGETGPGRIASTPGSGAAPTATVAAATAPPSASGSAETDREALVALYNATGGENWNVYARGNWLSEAPLGEWRGVTTNNNGRVIDLLLDGNGLSGELPPELGSLSNLGRLHLYDNELSGEIPAELGGLSNLRELILSGNELSGEIPAELGSLSDLRRLHLHDNELSGEIPAELGGLSELTRLFLNRNALSGEIPAELGSLSWLSVLDLHGNDLSGCVPSSLEDQLSSSSDLGDLPFC